MPEGRTVLIQLLRDSPPQLRKQLLLKGPVDVVLAICELALNVLENNVRVNFTKDQRQYIEQLADRRLPLKRKRHFLAKRRGGLTLLRTLLKAKYERDQEDVTGG